MIGAAMFYGSTLITPALSVLSAVEGLKVGTPAFDPFVLPLAVVILATLFAVQSRGTARVSAFFGPITTLWFVVLAVTGIIQIAGNPSVLLALNPAYGVAFLADHRFIGLVALGAVFLVVTGSEALYNDLGHFGRQPIQAAWIFLVLPALVLNYFGQGALLLADPMAIENPFFFLFPEWLLYPAIGLATVAAVIASQAVITGSYSITQQAIRPACCRVWKSATPRRRSLARSTCRASIGSCWLACFCWWHCSARQERWRALMWPSPMPASISALLGFMVIWKVWKQPLPVALLIVAPFLLIDATFVVATTTRILEGAWLPVVFAALVVLIMWTWRRGSRVLFEKSRRLEVPLTELVHNLEKHPPPRISGTAVFLTGDPDSTPTALLHSLKHFKVLHEKNVIMTVTFVDLPRVEEQGRLTIGEVGNSFTRITVRYGFMETPHLPKALAIVRKEGLSFDIMSTTFFLSRRTLRASKTSGMPLWQDHIFIVLARAADDASNYFHLPTDRVVEVGMQVTI